MKRILRTVFCALLACAVAPLLAAPASLKIEPQPLSASLQSLAKQSGVQIIFFSKAVEGHQAPALMGTFEPEDAVAMLLEGTGLDYHVLNERAIEVIAARTVEATPPPAATAEAETLSEVEITGKRQRLSSMRAELQRLEERFYAAYNKLNTGHEFEIVCTTTSRHGARTTNRVCQPAFVRAAARDANKSSGIRRTCAAEPLLKVLVKTPEYQQHMATIVEHNPELLTLLKERFELAQRYESLRTGKPVPTPSPATTTGPAAPAATLNARALVTCASRDPDIDKLPTQQWAAAMGLEPAMFEGRQYFCARVGDAAEITRNKSQCVSYTELRRARLNRPAPEVRGFDYPIPADSGESMVNMNPMYQP